VQLFLSISSLACEEVDVSGFCRTAHLYVLVCVLYVCFGNYVWLYGKVCGMCVLMWLYAYGHCHVSGAGSE